MNGTILPRFRFLGAAAVLLFAAAAATAQDTSTAPSGDAQQQQKKPSSTKAKKAKPADKTGDAGKKSEPGHYATESEASGHCRGSVVWVDQNHFNHYAGSREYGVKPGYFACE